MKTDERIIVPKTPANHIFGESEMAERVRAFDWSTTPVGSIETWPQTSITAVSICLNSRFPMVVRWGKELTNIYNDSYIPVLGKKHPYALGKPTKEVWGEVWPMLQPQMEFVFNEGKATWNERAPLTLERNGQPEKAWFTWSYSPIKNVDGKVEGIFVTCSEDTPIILAEAERQKLQDTQQAAQERDHFLLSLDDMVRSMIDPIEIILTNAEMLGLYLDVDRCAYADVEEDQDTMNLNGNYVRNDTIKSIVGRLKFSDFGPQVLQLMRDNKPYVVNDIDTHVPLVENK